MSNEINELPVTLPKNTGSAVPASIIHNDNKGSKTSPPASDSITLSLHAKDIQAIEASIKAQDEVDNNRIEELKKSIESGQYNIDPLQVAEKFIQFETLFAA